MILPPLPTDVIKRVIRNGDLADMPSLSRLSKELRNYALTDEVWEPIVAKHCPPVIEQYQTLKNASATGESPKTLKELLRWRKDHRYRRSRGLLLDIDPNDDRDRHFFAFVEFKEYASAPTQYFFCDMRCFYEETKIRLPTTLDLTKSSLISRASIHISLTHVRTGLQTSVVDSKLGKTSVNAAIAGTAAFSITKRDKWNLVNPNTPVDSVQLHVHNYHGNSTVDSALMWKRGLLARPSGFTNIKDIVIKYHLFT